MHRPIRVDAALFALGLVAASCEPGPSGSPAATGERSPQLSAIPTPSAIAPDGALMQVVADELRLRVNAGLDASLVAALDRGTVVRVESEATHVDGFAWHELVDMSNRRGWAADGDGTDAWLAPIAISSGADVIFSFSYGCDVVGPVNPPTVTILDDGRVIAIDTTGASVWWTRRLSEAGMASVRDDILGSPYLQASGEIVPRPKPGAEPPGHGACSFEFTIPTETDPIVVTSISWFGEPEESTFYEPAPERRALDHLARNLMAIGTVLGDDSWEAAPRLPYVADSYQVWIGDDPSAGPAAGPSINGADLGLGDIRSFGAPAGSGRCGTVGREVAFEVARVLNAAGATDPVPLDQVTFTMAQIDGVSSTIVLAPTTPDGQPRCDAFSL